MSLENNILNGRKIVKKGLIGNRKILLGGADSSLFCCLSTKSQKQTKYNNSS